MKIGRKLQSVIASVICVVLISLILTPLRANAYSHPQGLWKHFDRWTQALESKDYSTILELAPVIEALYKGEALNVDNCSILSILCENAARGSELKGDLEGAVAWLKKQLTYDDFLNKNGFDYRDRIIIAESLLRQLEVNPDIFTVSKNPSGIPYFGAIGEPKTGTLQGSVSARDNAAASGIIKSGESAILVYVEFEPDSEHTVQYWVEYLTNHQKGRDALSGKAAIELAWNFPKEADQLQAIVSGACDAYIIESVKYLSTLNTSIFLRIGAEMNVWTKLPEAEHYIAAFRKIADFAHQYSKNIALVFSPNDVSSWGKGYKDYYPGDTYADWIGVSTYYTGQASKNDYGVDAFYHLGVYSANPLSRIRMLVETFPNKPIIISECGFAYSASSADQTTAAVDRLKKFYSFLTMQYPQVKAVLYFDNDFKESPYRYNFAGSSALKNAYLEVIKNETYLTSIGGDAKGYTKLSAVNEAMEVLKLYTNALFPSNDAVTCVYSLDGKQIKTTNQVPFLCEIPVNSLTVGTHTIKVDITCGNISKTVERQITVSAGNVIKGGASADKPVSAPELTAAPTASTVFVNGKKTSFDAYNINDNNYFKLRDLAYVLSGTEAQFEVGWDNAKNMITLTSGKPYSVSGGEMQGKGEGTKTPTSTNSKITIDGKDVSLTAYNIDGNNYFKLRDIGKTFNFSVTWDGVNNAIGISTSEPYSD